MSTSRTSSLGTEFIAVQPHSLPHQEREVVHPLAGLNLKPVEQLAADQLHHGIQLLVEKLLVPMALDRKARQVDRGEGEVAAGIGDLTAGIIDVAHDPGTAAHRGDLSLGVAGLVVLQVEGAVEEDIVGEQPLGADLHAQLEQVVVGIPLVVVDPPP